MKKYDLQRRLASDLLKVGKSRIVFNPNKLKEIGEAITREDVRALIHNKSIKASPVIGVSRSRAKKIHIQKKKGRKRGPGSRKGKLGSRTPKKKAWMSKIRSQRDLLKTLINKKVINKTTYRKLYKLAKSGVFRSRTHLKLFVKKRGAKK